MMRFSILLSAWCAFSLTPVVAESAAEVAPKTALLASSAQAETLLRESKCAGCHAAKFATASDKTGDAIYTRKNRVVTSYAKLITQVARCDTELDLQVFEDDQLTISRYLNAQFYKFKVPEDARK